MRAQYEGACLELEEARAAAEAASLLSQELETRDTLVGQLREQGDRDSGGGYTGTLVGDRQGHWWGIDRDIGGDRQGHWWGIDRDIGGG